MKKSFDHFLFFVVVFIVCFSLIFFACLSASSSMKRFGNTNYYLIHQLAGYLTAIVAGFIAYKIPLKVFKTWSTLFVLLNTALMFMVFVPGIGVKISGASRWINLGFFTLQPSELLKITSILYLSAWIGSKLSEASASDWKAITKKGYHNIIYILFPFLIFLGLIFFALELQSDITTLGIISLTLLVIYFSAKTPFWHTVLIVIIGLSAVALFIGLEPYRMDRWQTFLNPGSDPMGKGYHIQQSLISLGSGGVFGKGLGMSTQKFGSFLPTAISDSIFAVIGEEFGAFGSIVLVGVFILFFFLGIRVAKNSTDRFGKMAAVGIVFWITFQAFISMASVAGLFPVAGIPLPFFSYGGSHLLAELIGVGLLLNISKNT